MDKFHSNPYNPNNHLITSEQVQSIMKGLHIPNFNPTNLYFYQTAFVHKSYCSMKEYEAYELPKDETSHLQEKSYETMEFLGDAILESVVSSYLYERFHCIHNQNEGFLTKLRIRLVCGVNLTALSKCLHFQDFLIISDQVEKSPQGRLNDNILEDVFESFIGALVLDQSYELASKFIISVIEKYVDFTEILMTDTNYKDQLSRYFQKSFKVYPIYKHTKKNDKIFCEIIKDGKSIVTGWGDSKKKSEQDASHKALCFYNVLTT
jgi:ribonuclease III